MVSAGETEVEEPGKTGLVDMVAAVGRMVCRTSQEAASLGLGIESEGVEVGIDDGTS